METVILEKTIIKLGSLLALGFGEAGANIVSSNMDGANSGVNAMVEGSMVNCIVGVVRILNFSTATEVLQGKVMTFVNQIAEIVHGVVDECWGAVNKNDGDNFLVIWRLGDLSANEAKGHPKNSSTLDLPQPRKSTAKSHFLGLSPKKQNMWKTRAPSSLQMKLPAPQPFKPKGREDSSQASNYYTEASHAATSVEVSDNVSNAPSVTRREPVPVF
eukprot:s3322_g5.t1